MGQYNWIIARAYRNLGHRVTVITKRSKANMPAFAEIEGIYVHRLRVADAYYWRRLPGAGRYVRSFQQLRYAWRLNKVLRRLHRERPIDVVEFAEVNAEGFFYARSPQVPVVVRCHTPTFLLARYYGPEEMNFDTRITAWCEKDLIRVAHALTAPSMYTARVVAKACDMPVERIAPIPNPQSLIGVSVDSQESNDVVTILHVGRLERVKGIIILADAIPRVLREFPRARFVFIGGDRPMSHGTSHRTEIERRLAETGALDRVRFLDEMEQAMLVEWYRRADICVVPSMLPESFSYTCAEAMAAGKPVVASRIGGIPETADDGVTGILVTPGNVDELVEAIIRLARDASWRERLGRAGRDKVRCVFDPIRIARRNLEVYECARERFAQVQRRGV